MTQELNNNIPTIWLILANSLQQLKCIEVHCTKHLKHYPEAGRLTSKQLIFRKVFHFSLSVENQPLCLSTIGHHWTQLHILGSLTIVSLPHNYL